VHGERPALSNDAAHHHPAARSMAQNAATEPMP
jgi:hypothetical protein